MRKLFLVESIALSLLLVACTNQQDNSSAFTTSMLDSHERAVENLEENTNLALSQTKSWLENPSRVQFSPIQLFAEQVDADITDIQLNVSKAQLLLEKGSSNRQESYLALRTELETLENKLNSNYQALMSQYQLDFSITDEAFVTKIENFAEQVTLFDEAWSSSRLEWSNNQFELMLAKTNLDLATVKNWIVNDLNSLYGGRAF